MFSEKVERRRENKTKSNGVSKKMSANTFKELISASNPTMASTSRESRRMKYFKASSLKASPSRHPLETNPFKAPASPFTMYTTSRVVFMYIPYVAKLTL